MDPHPEPRPPPGQDSTAPHGRVPPPPPPVGSMCAYPCVTPSETPWGRPRSLLSAGPRGRPTPGPRGERETAATGDHGPRQAAAIDAATLAPPGGRRGKLPRGSPPAPPPPPRRLATRYRTRTLDSDAGLGRRRRRGRRREGERGGGGATEAEVTPGCAFHWDAVMKRTVHCPVQLESKLKRRMRQHPCRVKIVSSRRQCARHEPPSLVRLNLRPSVASSRSAIIPLFKPSTSPAIQSATELKTAAPRRASRLFAGHCGHRNPRTPAECQTTPPLSVIFVSQRRRFHRPNGPARRNGAVCKAK